MRRVIVTGASGFIGKALTEALLKMGTEVWAVVRHADSLSDIDSDRLHIVIAAFENYQDLPQMISSRDIDAFFHFAWEGYGVSTNDYRIQVKNVFYSCVAAYAAVELGVKRFIFADSSHEFLMSKGSDGRIEPCSIYGTAKYCAQKMCKTIVHNANMEFIGTLFVNIFGVGDKSARSTNKMLKQIMNHEDLNLVPGEKVYNWTYIDDCIRGIIAAAFSGQSGIVYYVGGPARSFKSIMTDVCNALGANIALNYGTYPDNTYIDFDKIDVNALYRDTGFECQADFEDSIRRTADWLRQQGGNPLMIDQNLNGKSANSTPPPSQFSIVFAPPRFFAVLSGGDLR